MDKKSALNISKLYSDDVKSVYNPYKIMLYGSYSRGNQTDDSDIDIAVIFDGFAGQWLDVSADLWRMTERFNAAIEPVLLDIKDDQSGFCEEILNTGIEL